MDTKHYTKDTNVERRREMTLCSLCNFFVNFVVENKCIQIVKRFFEIVDL